MANRNFKASATCKSNIPTAGESPYTGDHARTWTRLKKGTVVIPPTAHGKQSQRNIRPDLQWTPHPASVGFMLRCSNKWPCLLKVGWPTVAISGYQRHIVVVLTCSALTYLHIRAASWSPDELWGQVLLNGALRQELHPPVVSQRPSMCWTACAHAHHCCVPKETQGSAGRGITGRCKPSCSWCWQGSSYHKGQLTLHRDIRRQVCYNSALVTEEKGVARLEKSYWRDWPSYATGSVTLQFEVSGSGVSPGEHTHAGIFFPAFSQLQYNFCINPYYCWPSFLWASPVIHVCVEHCQGKCEVLPAAGF